LCGSYLTLGLGRAGHKVTILEAAKEIGEVGAGVQLAPNATKILERWDLLEELSLSAVELSGASIRRWQNNEVLGELPFMPMVYSNHFQRKIHDKAANMCLGRSGKNTKRH
jgi:salicylate hydroxylase